MYSLRTTNYKYTTMLRYFKFEKIFDGDVLYDSSLYREHCVVFDTTTMWSTDDIIGSIISSSSTTITPPADTSTQYFLAPEAFELNAPRRVADLEEGFTYEMWFRFKSIGTPPIIGTCKYEIFRLYSSEMLVTLYFKDLTDVLCS